MMKLLLISYYFPPGGGAAVQRWLRLIRCLTDRGIDLSVVCSLGGDYPYSDPSLLAKVPPAVRVIRAQAPNMSALWQRLTRKQAELPYGNIDPASMSLLARALVYIRINFIIPDLRVFWNPAAYRAAIKELKHRPYDAVITTGPPHSSHLIGYRLKRETGIPWFTDFRDPWLDIHYLKLNPPCLLARMVHSYLQKKILRGSNGNFIISEAIAEALPEAPKTILYNGYDPLDFEGLSYEPASMLRIKYVGQLTAGQDPGLILELCARLQRRFELSFIGTGLNATQTFQLRQSLGDRLRCVSFLPHREALQEMVNSELLLLIINDYEGNAGMLTTKLFEYLAARSPILCIGPTDGAAARVIRDTESGKVFSPSCMSAAALWVNSLVPGRKNKGKIDSYSVDKQADTLINALRDQNSY